MLMFYLKEAGEHILSSDTIYQMSMTFMWRDDFFVKTVKHFYVFCFYQLIPMQMSELAWSLTYYSESAVEEFGEKYKNH